MRVALLANRLAGYVDACLRALADRGVELMIVARAPGENVAFEDLPIANVADVTSWHEEPDADDIRRRLDAFKPDVILVQSWDIPSYRAVIRHRQGALRVLWMDNPWRETARQWLGRLGHRWYVDPLYDVALVPGDRTEAFARRLGFPASAVIRGSLSADTALFGHEPVSGEELLARGRFIAILRLVHHKGADVLADAYASYRSQVDSPWGLNLVGLGPMASAFEGIEGVDWHGFQQPPQVARLMHESACLINPSRIEPFGVVLHEGCCAALPLLSTDTAGAAPTFVADGYNGWTVQADDADRLADAMARMSSLDPERLGEMSRVSYALSQRVSPQGWARNLYEEFDRRLGNT